MLYEFSHAGSFKTDCYGSLTPAAINAIFSDFLDSTDNYYDAIDQMEKLIADEKLALCDVINWARSYGRNGNNGWIETNGGLSPSAVNTIFNQIKTEKGDDHYLAIEELANRIKSGQIKLRDVIKWASSH